jgi:hypothetical protein
MPLDDFMDTGADTVRQVAKWTKEAVDALPPPNVDRLNRRSALQMCAAVAVDAGRSLFGGALRQSGIAVFQVASSYEHEEPKTYPFWIAPSLPDARKKEAVQKKLDELALSDLDIQRFVNAMGWKHAYGAMQPHAYNSAAAVGDYVREILEWSELYRLANVLNETRYLMQGLQPILLRDGALRFGTTARNISEPLGKLFKNLDIPIFGVTKQSLLLRNPVIRLWLKKHKVLQDVGPFCVWMEAEEFEELGWRIERYFGKSGFRFGHYAIVRFDSLSGSADLFAVDIPDYLFTHDRDKVLVLLSGLIQQVSATAYPVPGYPIALRQAHNKVVITGDRAHMLENSLRRALPPEAYEFLQMLA